MAEGVMVEGVEESREVMSKETKSIRKPYLMLWRKVGIAAFLFFLIKGIIWLIIGGVAIWGFWG
jgi:hypothetical protein